MIALEVGYNYSSCPFGSIFGRALVRNAPCSFWGVLAKINMLIPCAERALFGSSGQAGKLVKLTAGGEAEAQPWNQTLSPQFSSLIPLSGRISLSVSPSLNDLVWTRRSLPGHCSGSDRVSASPSLAAMALPFGKLAILVGAGWCTSLCYLHITCISLFVSFALYIKLALLLHFHLAAWRSVSMTLHRRVCGFGRYCWLRAKFGSKWVVSKCNIPGSFHVMNGKRTMLSRTWIWIKGWGRNTS